MAANLSDTTVSRRILQGIVEGGLWGGLAVLTVRFLRSGFNEGFVPLLQAFVVGGLLAAWFCVLGRVIAAGVSGALLGGLLGFLATSWSDYRQLTSLAQPQPTAGSLSPGQFLEITGRTLEGGDFDLESLRGKVVLVDFWATWCGPCVAEIPNLKRIYQKYHDLGLEVVGISLDQHEEPLRTFVKDKGVAWPQLFPERPDQRGGGHPLAQKYDINSIPRLVLVGRDGRILENELRGSAVERAVRRAVEGDALGWSLPIGLAMTFLIGPVLGALLERWFCRGYQTTLDRKPS